MSEKELDMNDLINDFNEDSTDYTKSACTYYANYLINYQKEKLELKQENQLLKDRIERAIEYIDGENPDAGVSGKEIKKILKGEKDEC